MVEKRFIIRNIGEDCIFDKKDCKYYDSLEMTIKLLNELVDENNKLKNTIKTAYDTERTKLGKSVLKQLMEAIE